jgi:hypothetical protein
VTIIALATIATGVAGLALGDQPLGISGVTTGFVALVCQQITLRRIFELVGIPQIAALGYAYGSFAVTRIQWRAALDLRARKPVRWGGRQYVLKPQSN